MFTASLKTLTSIIRNKHDEKPTNNDDEYYCSSFICNQTWKKKNKNKDNPMKINRKRKYYRIRSTKQTHTHTRISTILISAFSSFVFLLLYFGMNLICQVLICSIHFIFKYGLFHLRENGTAAQKECAHTVRFLLCVCVCVSVCRRCWC